MDVRLQSRLSRIPHKSVDVGVMSYRSGRSLSTKVTDKHVFFMLFAVSMLSFTSCNPTAVNRQAASECGTPGLGDKPDRNCGAISSSTSSSNISLVDLSGAAGNSSVTLSWKVSQSLPDVVLTDYIIEFSAEGDSSWTRFDDPVSTETRSTVTGLVNGKNYSFKVAAVTSKGQSSFVEMQESILPFGPPGRPRDLQVVDGNQSVGLSWVAPVSDGGRAISDYVVSFSDDGGQSWRDFSDGISSSNQAQTFGLTNGVSYIFRVSAKNIAGVGESIVAPIASVPFGVPSAPSGLSAIAGIRQVSLSWNSPENDNGRAVNDYKVEYTSNNGVTWSIFEDEVSSATNTIVTSLTPGVNYKFRVAAINLAGQSSFLETASSSDPFDIPTAPRNLEATAGIKQVSLSWNSPENDNGRAVNDYKVEYTSNNGVTWTVFEDEVSPDTSAIVTSLTPGVNYKFRVAALSDAGLGLFAATQDESKVLDLPSPPSNLSVTFEDQQRMLMWTAPVLRDFEGLLVDYIVEFSSDGGDQWTTLADDVSTTPKALINALPEAQSFKFRVLTQSTLGLSVPSEELVMTVDGTVTIAAGKTFVRYQEVKLPISVYVMGGGMSFLKNGNWFKFESIGYDRGIEFAKWNGSINSYFKVATLNSAPLQHTFSARSTVDKFNADNGTTNSYVSIELSMVDANGILVAYTNGNTGNNASPLNVISLADPSLSISAGEHPSIIGLTVSNSWMGGCNGGVGSYIAPFCTSTSPPQAIPLFGRVTLLSDDHKYSVVGDEGNLGDTVESYDPNTADPVKRSGFGAVAYSYAIGKNLVTMEDYAEFLNSVAQTDDHQLYSTSLASDTQAGGITRTGTNGSYRYQVVVGKSLRPVTYVSWLSAARYVNWLHNGKPVGTPGPSTTESGAYQLNANNDYADYPRSMGADYFLPTEDEWYKAAFYKGGGIASGYWRFATKSDVHPTASSVDSNISNRANFNSIANGTTNVGLFVSSPSVYGTFDQSGNVWQWLEGEGPVIGQKARRGGSWANTWPNTDPADPKPSRLSSEVRSASPISSSSQHLGFRVGKNGALISN